MNIIKLSDTIIPANSTVFYNSDSTIYPSKDGKYENAPLFNSLSQEERNTYLIDFYNTNLKSRYAYWIHMRYIIPLEQLSLYDIMDLEESKNVRVNKTTYISKLPLSEEGYPLYIDAYDCEFLHSSYIDAEETDSINNIDKYIIKNRYITDDDITLEEIRVFRTWLAVQLLSFDRGGEGGSQQNRLYDDKDTHMLQYYAGEMYDGVVKWLGVYGGVDMNYSGKIKMGCGCCNNQIGNLSSLYGTSLSVCDPLSIYKRNIYNRMVEVFSNIDFWKQFDRGFIKDFKKYIDNILTLNLPLGPADPLTDFVDCGCEYKGQERYVEILKRLSKSLQYYIDGSVNRHKNYVYDSLRDWAGILYENMFWK